MKIVTFEGDLLFHQNQFDADLGPISSSRVQSVSISICLLTSVMMPEGSVVMIASMLDSNRESVELVAQPLTELFLLCLDLLAREVVGADQRSPLYVSQDVLICAI
jgi:hypothetical protein